MSKKKAFWISLIISLGILVPIYAVFIIMHVFNKTPVNQQNVTVPISSPSVEDAKNILLVTGEKEDVFIVLRFDALQNKISACILPKETVVLNGGKAITVSQAMEYAGPALVNQSLSDTLTLSMDNFICIDTDTFLECLQGAKSTPLNMEDLPLLKDLAVLRKFAFNDGISSLNAPTARDILLNSDLTTQEANELRSILYGAFLQGTRDNLKQIVPNMLKSKNVTTDVLATQIYHYEKICTYFLRKPPEVYACVMSGEYKNGQYVLNDNSLAIVKEYFS